MFIDDGDIQEEETSFMQQNTERESQRQDDLRPSESELPTTPFDGR